VLKNNNIRENVVFLHYKEAIVFRVIPHTCKKKVGVQKKIMYKINTQRRKGLKIEKERRLLFEVLFRLQ